MLLHPNPADWLVVRGNYQSWNHSFLSQITPKNVGDLRLAWVWSMNEGYANQPQPLVHNGIMYLFNTDNSCRPSTRAPAFDFGKSGTSHRPARRRTGAIRNLAIYGDKVFVPTPTRTSPSLMRAPENAWDVEMGDYTKGLGNSDGPIVITEKCFKESPDATVQGQPEEQGCSPRLRSGHRQTGCGDSTPLPNPESPAANLGQPLEHAAPAVKRGSREATTKLKSHDLGRGATNPGGAGEPRIERCRPADLYTSYTLA